MKKTYIIGYDIGGTKCAVSLGRITNDKIEISDRMEVPTGKDPLATLAALGEHIGDYAAVIVGLYGLSQ